MRLPGGTPAEVYTCQQAENAVALAAEVIATVADQITR